MTVAAALAILTTPILTHPVHLTCESLTDPLGIDEPHPRLAWQLESAERNVLQTAYRIQVASTETALEAEKPDLWDTGKVQGDRSIQLPYQGRTLFGRMRCHWRVRVWTNHGVTPWSSPALWTMGLLHPSHWGAARWIGIDRGGKPSAPLDGAQWLWSTAGADKQAPANAVARFVRSIQIEAKPVRSAVLTAAADNTFDAWINGNKVGSGDSWQAPTRMDVAGQLHPGSNDIRIEAHNTGDQPSPAGFAAILEVTYADGKQLKLQTDAQWKVSGTVQDWSTSDGWGAAPVLGPFGMDPWGRPGLDDNQRLPARYLRKEFHLLKPIGRATATVCGLGLFELHINGSKIGDHVLEPPVTDFDHVCTYVSFDVTHALRQGRNAAGVVLGNGRFHAPRLQRPTRTKTFGTPRLLLRIDVAYADGTKTSVVSDRTWTATDSGPIVANNEYDGEEIDARKDLGAWDGPGYRGSWPRADPMPAPHGRLVAMDMPPIRVTGTLRPVKIWKRSPGVWILDMGQNLVGWCRLTARGKQGDVITVRHAERLTPSGELDVANLRSARATDIFTLKGGRSETFEPRFVYHGFRYVELQGYPGRPTAGSVAAQVVNDDLGETGQFSCSDALLNGLVRNVRWGVRGNYHGIVTDCPQRDERQGWLGDRAEESNGEAYLFDTEPIYSKWMRDIVEDQGSDGIIGDVVPALWPDIRNVDVTWPSLGVIVPGILYDQFGDLRTIERSYPTLQRWMALIDGTVHDGTTKADAYGDWCVPPEDPKLIHSNDPARQTSGELLATSYHYHNLKLMARYARLLGKPADAATYEARAKVILDGFNRRFLDRRSLQYDNGTQTSSLLPLAFGMVPDDARAGVVAALRDRIVNRQSGHSGSGLIGMQWTMRTLTDNGLGDVAYGIAAKRDYPSWGYMLGKGATTVWELWNGDTADPAMNSGNHVMLIGDLTTWIFGRLGGIQPDPEQPGYKRILLAPTPLGDLKWAKASLRSPYGLVESNWKLRDGKFVWDVLVPPNTTALATLPLQRTAAAEVDGLRVDGSKPIRLGSGRHHLVSVASGS
jgi:alpha-L-rhamnosidase